MSTVVDVSALGAGGFVIEGDGSGDRAGFSVSAVGDFNGDGLDDLIVGAPLNDSGGDNSGAAYLIYGKAGGLGTIDVANLQVQPGDGFRIQGDRAGSSVGLSVSDGGDINGDGFDDIIVGATVHGLLGYGFNLDAYVIFGFASKTGGIDLANLPAANGFVIRTGLGTGYTGNVAAAGDINGDGFGDIILGSPYDRNVGGAAYVIFGKASGFGTIDATKPGGNGFAILGSTDLFRIGASVSGAGDINGDGFDDIIVTGDKSGFYHYGAFPNAYVIFGKQAGFTNLNLSSLAASDGFVIHGFYGYGTNAFTVSGAGDVNGDGFADILIGSVYEKDHAGAAYVIYGKASGFGSIDLATLAPAAGFAIHGDRAQDLTGFSVSSAGDVNGDGYDDLVVGAPLGDDGGSNAGEAYVIFGKAAGVNIDLSNLASGDTLFIKGDAPDDRAGFSVSGGADINGDGAHDIIVGAPYSDIGGADAGAAYVIYGSPGPIRHAAHNDFNGDGRSDVLWQSTGGTVTDWLGRKDGSFTGNAALFSQAVAAQWHIVGTGDFNGDGRADVLFRNDDGMVTDWLGRLDGTFAGNAAKLGTNPGSQWHVAGTGDFNGDGRSDILLRSDSGMVTEWLGQSDGSMVANGAVANNVSNDWHVVGTGDFNGDGRADVVWQNTNGIVTDWLGRHDGTFAGNAAQLSVNPGAQWHVVASGDFNGDGRDDLFLRDDTGTMGEWLGHGNGSMASNPSANGFVATDWHVVGTGDFNGDGKADVLWQNADGTTLDWLGRGNGSFTDNSVHFRMDVASQWHVQDPFVHDSLAG